MSNSKFLKALIIVLSCLVPFTSYAQSDDPFVVGLLVFDTNAFIQEMETLGYVQGENIEYRILAFQDIDPELYLDQEAYMAEYNRLLDAVITAPLDVLAVQTDTEAVAMRERTTAPIVFSVSDNPVATGAIQDLTTPGGNTTGVITNQHHTRRLQLLKEINPDTDVVYYLYSSFALEGQQVLDEVSALGEELGIEVIAAPVADAVTGIEALNNVPEGADWIFLTPFLPFDLSFNDELFNVSMAQKIPIAGFVAQPTFGYLLTYGPSLSETARQAASLTDQILRGANASEIPVSIADNILILNLEAAEALGVDLSRAVLRQANQIMRPGDFEVTPMPEEPGS